MQAEIVVLRLVHVLGGILWVGSGLFNTLFLLPALGAAGPAAGQVMAGLQRRRLFTVLPIVAVLTILSGIRLLQLTSANFSAAYFRSPSGRTFAWAGVAAIVAFVLGMLFVRPAGARAGALAQQLATMPAGPERTAAEATLDGLRKRTAIGGIVVNVALVAAAAGMAVARYVG